MAGIRPPDNATPVAPPELTEERLYTICSLFAICSIQKIGDCWSRLSPHCTLSAGFSPGRGASDPNMRTRRTPPIRRDGFVVVLNLGQRVHLPVLADRTQSRWCGVGRRH